MRKNLCRCKNCRIFFICCDSNRGRNDIGCPFGCALESRKKKAQKRSSEYYKTEEGKGKKKQLNKKRASKGKEKKEKKSQLKEEKFKKILLYLQFIFLRTDKISHQLKDIEAFYKYSSKIVRQHSLFFKGRIEYIRDG